MKGELHLSISGSVFSVGRIHEHHVEVQVEDELKRRENVRHGLEVVVLGIGHGQDLNVMEDNESKAREGVEHDHQCSAGLRWVEVEHGTGVVEVEQLVDVSLGGVKITWCTLEFLHESMGILVWGEDNHVC